MSTSIPWHIYMDLLCLYIILCSQSYSSALFFQTRFKVYTCTPDLALGTSHTNLNELANCFLTQMTIRVLWVLPRSSCKAVAVGKAVWLLTYYRCLHWDWRRYCFLIPWLTLWMMMCAIHYAHAFCMRECYHSFPAATYTKVAAWKFCSPTRTHKHRCYKRNQIQEQEETANNYFYAQ